MSQAQFKHRVDHYLSTGMTLDQAISAAGNDCAHWVDPFVSMRAAALDKVPGTA